MKYVTDLLSVRPEEIQHVDGHEVLGIHHNLAATSELTKVFVVMRRYTGGVFSNYFSQDGDRDYQTKTGKFIYKPRKKRVLKPLHQILAENPGYRLDSYGVVIFAGDNTVHQNPPIFRVSNRYLYKFEGGVEVEEKYDCPDSFTTEVDCE